jgi:Cft2 family RNA processing exonuclease
MLPGVDDDTLSVIPLGAGSEVGRSCVVLKFKKKTVLFDCGVHPAYSGLAALPFFDEIDPSEIDVILITHFHLDHCAGLPYLVTQTNLNPRARILMTHPTKAVYRTLIGDFVRVGSSDYAGILYTESDLNQTISRIECIDYHQQIDISGVRISAYNAGHVLGAAMFLVEIAGVTVLYTGDFSRQEDRHLMEAEIPRGTQLDVLICESTYGVQVHEPRRVREGRFTQRVADVVKRGGRCLLPVFALGRAQELLLILEEYWDAHPELQEIPIYYSSSIAKRCMAIYSTYIHQMNQNIQQRYRRFGNPFAFKYVTNIRSLDSFEDAGPCVFMASPGMLQSGTSRRLFEKWCSDRRNGVVLPGYSVQGTLAKYILTEPATVPRLDGQQVPLRCSVDYITFSAHSDFMQTSEFIEQTRPSNVILVHGEKTEMQRLAQALDSRFNRKLTVEVALAEASSIQTDATEKDLAEFDAETLKDDASSLPGVVPGSVRDTIRLKDTSREESKRLRIFTPKNTKAVLLRFHGEVIGKAIGSFAKNRPEIGKRISGVILKRDYKYSLLEPSDLEQYTAVKTARIHQRLIAPFVYVGGYPAFEAQLRRLFERVDTEASEKRPDERVLSIQGIVRATIISEASDEHQDNIIFEWVSSYQADGIVDALIALVADRASQPPDDDSNQVDFTRELCIARRLLAERFGSLEIAGANESRIEIHHTPVLIDHKRGEVKCEDQKLRDHVNIALRRIYASLYPIPDWFCGCS